MAGPLRVRERTLQRRARKSKLPAKDRLTTGQLSKSLGVDPRTVRRWTDRGCPCTQSKRKKAGRPGRLFDPFEVKSWLVANGITPKMSKGATADAGAPAPPADESPSPKGFEGMHERLQVAERSTFALWVKAMKGGSVDVAARARQWRDTAEQLRKVEKDLATVRKDKEDWLPRSMVVRLFERLANELRTKFIGIPAAVTPRLVGQKAPRIQKILSQEIRGVLSELSRVEIAE